MNQPAPSSTNSSELSIMELPAVLTDLFTRAQRPLLPEAQGPLGLFVRYLRRKPARGLAVIYTVDELRSSQPIHANDPHRSVSLTLDEKALNGAHILFSAEQARQAEVGSLPSGVLHSADLGLSVQAFPADAGLPALVASCDTAPDGPIFEALQTAAQNQLQDNNWRLLAAQAVPVRYKPANRCVIRYHLRLQHTRTANLGFLTIFGKVYADPAQAQQVQALQQQLYSEQASSGEGSFLPCPLGLIENLGLTFNEAVQPTQEQIEEDPWSRLRTGTHVMQPQLERGRGGTITQIIIPEEELRLTAQALARLHNSHVHPGEDMLRPGAREAKRARERAALIAGHNPAQAEEAQRLAKTLAARLEQLQPDTYRPAHGGFKASQLLFHSHHVFVVDFDGFCLADPALDVGYFLAYLRPSGLWYYRAGMREWFNEAARIFRQTYTQEMLKGGVSSDAITGILHRSRLYEAALIFKIATRRVNRLNSPRPKELSAMLDEISMCLA